MGRAHSLRTFMRGEGVDKDMHSTTIRAIGSQDRKGKKAYWLTFQDLMNISALCCVLHGARARSPRQTITGVTLTLVFEGGMPKAVDNKPGITNGFLARLDAAHW